MRRLAPQGVTSNRRWCHRQFRRVLGTISPRCTRARPGSRRRRRTPRRCPARRCRCIRQLAPRHRTRPGHPGRCRSTRRPVVRLLRPQRRRSRRLLHQGARLLRPRRRCLARRCRFTRRLVRQPRPLHHPSLLAAGHWHQPQYQQARPMPPLNLEQRRLRLLLLRYPLSVRRRLRMLHHLRLRLQRHRRPLPGVPSRQSLRRRHPNRRSPSSTSGRIR